MEGSLRLKSLTFAPVAAYYLVIVTLLPDLRSADVTKVRHTHCVFADRASQLSLNSPIQQHPLLLKTTTNQQKTVTDEGDGDYLTVTLRSRLCFVRGKWFDECLPIIYELRPTS